jgi:hypothetical protein
MLSRIPRKLSFVAILAALALPVGTAAAQSTPTKPPPPPPVITGTNPEPQVILAVLLTVLATA